MTINKKSRFIQEDRCEPSLAKAPHRMNTSMTAKTFTDFSSLGHSAEDGEVVDLEAAAFRKSKEAWRQGSKAAYLGTIVARVGILTKTVDAWLMEE